MIKKSILPKRNWILLWFFLFTNIIGFIPSVQADDWDIVRNYLIDKYSDTTSPDFNIYGYWQILIPKSEEILNRNAALNNFNTDYYSFDYIFKEDDSGGLRLPQSSQFEYFRWTVSWVTNAIFIYFPNTTYVIKLKWLYNDKFQKKQNATVSQEVNEAINQGLLLDRRGLLGWELMNLDQEKTERVEQIRRELAILEQQKRPYNENTFLVYYSTIQINKITGAQSELSTTYAIVTRRRLATSSDNPSM
jgi:hypothetical protein